jgi:putative transposase
MPRRKTPLVSDETYHVFNRGVARMPVFSTVNDFMRFLDVVDYCRFANTKISFSHYKQLPIELRSEMMSTLRNENKLHIEIFAFCLMDNHYHFLVKQLAEKGITTWISNVQNGYAKYYNIRTKRTGPLFQPRFQAVRIETEEQLLHVSRYIHLNPSTSHLVSTENILQYVWSSFPSYIAKSNYSFMNTEMILELMHGREKYQKFVFDQASYQKELAHIKHLIFE